MLLFYLLGFFSLLYNVIFFGMGEAIRNKVENNKLKGIINSFISEITPHFFDFSMFPLIVQAGKINL